MGDDPWLVGLRRTQPDRANECQLADATSGRPEFCLVRGHVISVRILNLIGDLTARNYAGYQSVLASHAEGSLEAEKLQIVRSYDATVATGYAGSLAALRNTDDSPLSYRGAQTPRGIPGGPIEADERKSGQNAPPSDMLVVIVGLSGLGDIGGFLSKRWRQ